MADSVIESEKKSGYFEIASSLIKLGIPVLVTQVGIIVVSFADTMMVGAMDLTNLQPPLLSTASSWCRS